MRKISFKYLLIIILGVSALLAYFYFSSQPANVFEELYKIEASQTSEGKKKVRTTFQGIPGVAKENLDGATGFETNHTFTEGYTPSSLPTGESILIYFVFKPHKEALRFYFDFPLENQVTLEILANYDVGQKRLTKDVRFIKTDQEESFIKDKEEIKSLLKQYRISQADLDAYFTKAMQDRVLKDWTSVYPSRFSPDDWGAVEVEDIWKVYE